jgi:hypothetical protein
MKSVVPKSPPGSEFDHFLFAPVGVDRNGLPLSVISLFARLDLDPWQEAGNLAALSANAAARSLALRLDTLTDPVLRAANPEATVLRLLALLPRRAATTVHTPAAGTGAVAAPDPASRIRTILFIASAALLVGSQIFAAHRYTPGPPVAVPGSTAQPAPAQMPPAPAGH